MEFSLGIDIGGSKLRVGTISSRGDVICSNVVDISKVKKAEKLVEIITENSNKLLLHCQLNISTCGIAIPGLTDSDSGEWVFSPFSGIKNFPIASIIEKQLKLKTSIENDVNVSAIAEKLVGNCQDVKNFFWMTVSNGIGGAFFMNDQLYKGAFEHAGEIGHLTVVKDGESCGCGGRGCLEKYASGASIERIYQQETNEYLSAKEIARKATMGDEFCYELYQQTGRYLGKALSYVANLLNIQKIVLGGGVSLDYDLFSDSLLEQFREDVFMKANKDIIIEKTMLSNQAALIGAGLIAMK